MPESSHLEELLGQRVVLDTQGPLMYIGALASYDNSGYLLKDADVHDRSDGHSTKEVYLNDARELERSGARRVNRRRVFVMRSHVASVSALSDVVADEDGVVADNWLPD